MPNTYSPREKAPSSGLYVVTHPDKHAEKHYVTVLQGDAFPSCLGCSHRVRFELAISAAYVYAHPLFKCDA